MFKNLYTLMETYLKITDARTYAYIYVYACVCMYVFIFMYTHRLIICGFTCSNLLYFLIIILYVCMYAYTFVVAYVYKQWRFRIAYQASRKYTNTNAW